jgi:hypothetical protein
MIIIFSTHDDVSTHLVVEWLLHYHAQPVVVNETNPIVDICFDIDNNTRHRRLTFTLLSGLTIADNEIDIVWYRRGSSFFKFPYRVLEQKNRLKPIYHHLRAEYESLSKAFFAFLRPKTIGDYNQTDPNKLMLLQWAMQAGFNVPTTKILCKADDRLAGGHINKNIANILHVLYNRSILYNRTTVQHDYPTGTFFPSLTQLCINKYCELRIFIFDNEFYAMASLPLNNETLQTDIRDITGNEQLNRFPFALPAAIKDKLRSFIAGLGYSTCSIDMLIDEKGDYYFLEINPVGQFGALSVYCDYSIEKDIAQKLSEYGKGKTYQRVAKGNPLAAIDLL